MHVLISYAACQGPAAASALAGLQLPHLMRLLGQMQARPASPAADANSLSPPHEQALAQALGLPVADGQIPWAAHQARQLGLDASAAWAWVTPCHWQVGTDQITLADPAALALSAQAGVALHAALAPYFAEDGIALLPQLQPLDSGASWLARSAVFAGLACASVERVVGRNVNAWMPEGAQAAPLRRLQNEMQMLLYTHPLNDARAARGLPPVNSFWLHGSGALAPAAAAAPAAELLVPPDLRGPALQQDWPAWQAAWRHIDATACAALLDRLRRSPGEHHQLTLCGERAQVSYVSGRRPLFTAFLRVFASEPNWSGSL